MRRSPRNRFLLCVLALLLASCDGGVRGGDDVGADVAASDVDELPLLAEALIATERPWRASRAMLRYLDEVEDAPAAHRVLAARAEAGRGGWDRVLALLEDIPSLDTHEGGIGLWLLGRARGEAGDATGAVEAYRAFLALSPPAGEMEQERRAARLRLGLALLRTGDAAVAERELRAPAERMGATVAWLDVLKAASLARVGDTAGVRRAVANVEDRPLALRAWRARVEAARRAGDLPAARDAANAARAWARTDATRSEFLLAASNAALAMGDVAAGRDGLRAVIDLDRATPHARAAADSLLAGDMGPADHLAVARVDAAMGLHEEAIEHYRGWLDSASGRTASDRRAVLLEYADALHWAERYAEVEEALRPVTGGQDARMLLASAAALQGDHDRAVALYLGMPGTYPLFLAADARHDAGELDEARALYGRVVASAPGSDRAGLALMRLAGIAFLEEDFEEAARIWDGYRARYPSGSRALQATYWAGRAREERGDEDSAATLFRQVRNAERDSYYALLASERLGEPFWPLPMAPDPVDDPGAEERVSRWMQGIDLLRQAGFPDEASAEVDRVVDRAAGDRATRYALAEALVERGYSQRAIRIAIGLEGSGPPSRRLLRILYPFPYRTLITEEATDRGIDPSVAAALIRQESLFEARITSHVGARGLMQLMPRTGRQVAESVGLDRWDPELLYLPEVNVHLGTRLLADHLERYDGSLPAVFGAYNAGEHRVERWSGYPEFGNDELFTERIPFSETRDYVKILTRNRALYQGLYGEE